MAQVKDNTEDLGEYSARHPRRMASGMFIVGSLVGASIMAAKLRHDTHKETPLERFLDNLNSSFKN
jgi:hypothetical protein